VKAEEEFVQSRGSRTGAEHVAEGTPKAVRSGDEELTNRRREQKCVVLTLEVASIFEDASGDERVEDETDEEEEKIGQRRANAKRERRNVFSGVVCVVPHEEAAAQYAERSRERRTSSKTSIVRVKGIYHETKTPVSTKRVHKCLA